MPYVESPLDRIVDVHFGVPTPTVFSIFWGAAKDAPLYEPGLSTMDVSVDGLPTLRSHLAQGVLFLGTPPIPVTIPPSGIDQVSGEFPDGTSGTIRARYEMDRQGGDVRYSTTAQGHHRFGGADSVSISLVINLVGVFHGTGYNWNAVAHADGVIDQMLSGFVASTAGSEGTLHFTATMTLGPPPSLSFGHS
jgi:hypothetical protein